VESKSPWIIDSSAFDQIFGDTSLFSALSFPKNPHFINLGSGSKVSTQGVLQVSPFSFIKYKICSFCSWLALESLSQLTKSLNCSITFNPNSFVI